VKSYDSRLGLSLKGDRDQGEKEKRMQINKKVNKEREKRIEIQLDEVVFYFILFINPFLFLFFIFFT
jgi:hypothetical protein